MGEPIISRDVQRENRIPPRQALTRKWPVLHYGEVPSFDRARWTFHIWAGRQVVAVHVQRIHQLADNQSARRHALRHALE